MNEDGVKGGEGAKREARQEGGSRVKEKEEAVKKKNERRGRE